MRELSSEFNQEHRDWLICTECGELQTSVPLTAQNDVRCCNCSALIHAVSKRWLEVSSALAFTSLVLFILAIFCPILTLEIGSQSQSVTVIDGFFALLQRDNWVLSALIITTLFLFPLFEIFGLLYLLVPYMYGKHLPGQAYVLRWLVLVKQWSMLEVFLLSMVISSVKMADMAILRFEIGAYALCALVGVLILAFSKLDRHKLWSWINTNNYFTQVVHEPVYDCRVCSAAVGESIAKTKKRCPRCFSKITRRIQHSMQKTVALIIAAIILYIPANVLPIMTYSTLGAVETDTIYSGVVSLVSAELYWIAFVVFTASIVVPIAKILILSYLVWSARFKTSTSIHLRMKLYRFTDFIGRWSMIDVFVVTIFVALVQFGFLYTVEPENAIIAFAAVVVLTMIAADAFDPRLMWDALEEKDESQDST